MWSWWSVKRPFSPYRPGVGSCIRSVVGRYCSSTPAIACISWSFVYVNGSLTGVPEVSWASSAGIRPFHRPRRLAGLSPPVLRASRSISHTRWTCGLARRTSTSARPPPTVGMTVRRHALVRSPVAIWA